MRPSRPSSPALLPVVAAVAMGFAAPRSLDPVAAESRGLERAIALAEKALAGGDLDIAEAAIRDALERDARSTVVWNLESRWARAAGNRDREVYALHKELALGLAQKLDRRELDTLRARVLEVDPLAGELFGLKKKYVDRFRDIADEYAADGWAHAAIATHKKILALDPDNQASADAIQKLASAPDPSLAADAKKVDLMENVSEAWVLEHDAAHADWKNRSKLERDNYVTETNAGYEVMIRAAEAMEQMNAFYRVFFDYGTDGKGVSRITLRIFRNKDEYLKLGSGPPVDWSAGQFTGSAVETYTGESGFVGMTGTLFHEAAHQFVSLATNAAGWLNEGLASFFEGCRILSNGTVLMNQPANHRLFPLVRRMRAGWMKDANDGIDPANASTDPERAPTFRIVLENQYQWGPPWYAPTWGVVYFLYNFQDPADGRFVYREAFREYIDRSGGLVGGTAIDVFEEIVLGNPAPVTKGATSSQKLPRSVDELSVVWKDWLFALEAAQSGKQGAPKPYLLWARNAITRGDDRDAAEFFEKGLEANQDDTELLMAFGEFLMAREGEDRAVKLFRHAQRLFEERGEDTRDVERYLRKLDPQVKKLEALEEALVADAKALPKAYLDAELELMAMDVAWRLGSELAIPELYDTFRTAIEREGRSLAIWQLAYNEENLRGWNTGGDMAFEAVGDKLESEFGKYQKDRFEYRFLTLDQVTSGDFSMEADVQVVKDQVAFAGLVFGQKSDTDFHALILFPPSEQKMGFADLASFYGSDSQTWRHEPVNVDQKVSEDTAGRWYRLRVDVTGAFVDMWVNGEHTSTQEFPSRDVLRGSFGLLTGVGEARFKRVRFLSRNPEDPSARVERELRVEKAAAARGASAPVEAPEPTASGKRADVVDTSPNGTWLGLRPPFPTGATWVQGERESWNEAYGSPQLLVLWSCDQNDAVQIDTWLTSLAKSYAHVDLRIVSVGLTWDDERIMDYLASHPFPGAVALDERNGSGDGGVMFDQFAVDRFFLPRLILIDINGRVVWEGDPGFSSGKPWNGQKSFLHTPLQNLISNRKLTELTAWRKTWEDEGVPALASGDIETALPILKDARQFAADGHESIADAQKRLTSIERAISGFADVAEELAADGREPALLALRDWATLLGTPIDAKANRKVLASDTIKDWEKALSYLKATIRKAESGKDASLPDAVYDKLAALSGPFVEELRADLTDAKGDPERVGELCLGAARRPTEWLTATHFGW